MATPLLHVTEAPLAHIHQVSEDSTSAPADDVVGPRNDQRREPIHVGDDEAYSLNHFSVPIYYEPYLSEILLTNGNLHDRIEKLASDMLVDYKDITIHFLCVLKGASTFFKHLSDSLRSLHDYANLNYIPFTFDFVRVDFGDTPVEGDVSAGGDGGMVSSSNVRITGIDASKLCGKHVIFVEDVVNTGRTLLALREHMKRDIGAASVRFAALMEKRTPRSNGFKANYVGFSIPDKVVVGFGVDHADIFRNLSHVAVLNEAGLEKFRS